MRKRENLYYTILYKKYCYLFVSCMYVCMYVSAELFVRLLTVYCVSYCIILYYIMQYYNYLFVSCMYVCLCQLNCSYEGSKYW
jgi:hypothetical protein